MIAVPDDAAPGYYVGPLLSMLEPIESVRVRARQLGYVILRLHSRAPEVFRRGRWRTMRRGPRGTATVVLQSGRRIEVKWDDR